MNFSMNGRSLNPQGKPGLKGLNPGFKSYSDLPGAKQVRSYPNPVPGTMGRHPIATKIGGAGLGLLALSHAKNSIDSMRYGDMTTAALNAGVAGAAGYGAYHMMMGSHNQIGQVLQNKALTPMLHGLRDMKKQYPGNREAMGNIVGLERNVKKLSRAVGRFFA